MIKFILDAIDPSGNTHNGSFLANSFEDGLNMLGEMGAKNIKSHDPFFCTDAIRSWDCSIDGLHWNVMAGPGPKK